MNLNGKMQCLRCDLAGDTRGEPVQCEGRYRQLQTDTHTHTAEIGAERGYKPLSLISYFPVVTVKLTFSVPDIPVNGSLG